MFKKKHPLTPTIIIAFVFVSISLFSCKTSKENIKPVADKSSTELYMKVEGMDQEQEEEKQILVTRESIEEEKRNEYAKKKSGLLCSLNQLKTELENTTDVNQKAEINRQIVQLKKQISEFDIEINIAFPDQQHIDEINKIAQSLMKDC